MSSLVKSQQNTQFCQIWSNMKMSTKYEVLIKQYLNSIQDMSSQKSYEYSCWKSTRNSFQPPYLNALYLLRRLQISMIVEDFPGSLDSFNLSNRI